MQMDKDADKFGWIKSLGRRIVVVRVLSETAVVGHG